ncbi:hypothetical protein ASPWEDRAFT_177869 [Aspergillus wentii DTO 134E9]|uniref:Uncharacterized protein n=1 Tax=Aspergillus wentii DTO 134E9 TaxID=1073089 RepID=A0A1L9R3V5_ASPWE|nr:uncharacterized protein ASPWEDRAFT_177869 [Aspergillus wentii DTO 134E9]KAI9923415.1 hypothetical protein MW887_009345 [Aspergillus wentii]OJJ29563.1 hypothetical protein ASPWEDRAFT_177869 [Aspergillus wentii DTO 134E9]
MSPDANDIDIKLKTSGVALAGTIDLNLIRNLQSHLEPQNITRRITRQTHLQWNGDCDAIEAHFESKIKPQIQTLSSRTCSNRWLVHFHDFPERSNIYKPNVRAGKYTVLIVVKMGPGFPLLCEGTHLTEGAGISPVTSIMDIPQEEGSVVIFDASIARQDPMVKGPGGSCILLAY